MDIKILYILLFLAIIGIMLHLFFRLGSLHDEQNKCLSNTFQLFKINFKNEHNILNGYINKKEAQNQIINGYREGKWINYYDLNLNIVTGITKAAYYELAIYKNDKKIGMVRKYTMCGNIYSTTPYSIEGDIIEGDCCFYNANGQLRDITPYHKGEFHGLCKFYHVNGNLKYEIPFINGIKQGLSKWYYKNGHLQSEINYLNGLRNGITKNYFIKGQLKSEVSYINGEKNGNMKKYFESGQLECETHFNNNCKEGVEICYNKDGLILSINLWQKGKIVQS